MSDPCEKCPSGFPSPLHEWNNMGGVIDAVFCVKYQTHATDKTGCPLRKDALVAQRAREEYSYLINAELTTGDFTMNYKDAGAKEILEKILGDAAHPEEEAE